MWALEEGSNLGGSHVGALHRIPIKGVGGSGTPIQEGSHVGETF